MSTTDSCLLETKGLKKSFDDNQVLKGIDFTIDRKQVISFIGASGSGKSTFVRCLNFLELKDSGSILFKGNEICPEKDDLNDLRSKIGMVFQHFNLFPHRTVLQNITEAPIHVRGMAKAEALEKAKELLDKVGLLEKVSAYPSALSGGQKQRVAIARALAMEPELMLFDEPTSALDPETIGEVTGVMQQLAEEGMTMIMVTHEMRFAREISDSVCFLHQGEILEQAAPDILFDNPQEKRTREFLRNVQG